MKKIALFSFLFSLVSSSFAGTLENIISAIKNNDAEVLSEYFDGNIDLKILEKENIFSKAQARIMFKDFISNHKVTNVTLNHQGGPENARFAICNLNTSDGAFRLYFLLKLKEGQLLIQKFRIEKDG